MLKIKDIEKDERLSEKAKKLLKISIDINNIKTEEFLSAVKETLPDKLDGGYSKETIDSVLVLKPDELLEYILQNDSLKFSKNYEKINIFNDLLNKDLTSTLSLNKKVIGYKKSLLGLPSPYRHYGKKLSIDKSFDFISKSVFKTSIINNETSFKIVKRFGLSNANIKYFLKGVSKENIKNAFNDEEFMQKLIKYIYFDKIQSMINKVSVKCDYSYHSRLNDLESKYSAPVLIINKNATDSIPKYNIEVGVNIDIKEYDNKDVIIYTSALLIAISNTMLNLGFN